jgi:putative SOS response-associated peptidase YedK
MRSADAIEKITLKNPTFLKQYKASILKLIETAKHIELKWHLALIVSRLELAKKEFRRVWRILTDWAKDKKESKIVRVNSMQGLFNLLQTNQELKQDFNLTISQIEKENIPSINARIRNIKKQIPQLSKRIKMRCSFP